jgi:long-chain acyl-CoA synthetase
MKFKTLMHKIKKNEDAKIHFSSTNSGPEEYTFAQLSNDVEKLSDELISAGIQKGDRIGILADNCYEWLVWDLAIQCLDCISVAFTSDFFNNDSKQLLSDYNLVLLATEKNHVNDKSVVSIATSLTEKLPELRETKHDLTNSDIHSLVFSSGTSGNLKGLIISKTGTEFLTNLFTEAFDVNEFDEILIFLPFANYQQRMLYYTCLYVGASISVTPPLAIYQTLKNRRPTFFIAPPLLYDTLKKTAITIASQKNKGISQTLNDLLGGQIRFLIVGMAKSSGSTLRFYIDNDVSLYEAYGITEAGMVAWNTPQSSRLGTVGKPAEKNTIWLNKDNEVIIQRKYPLSLGYFQAKEEERATFSDINTVSTGDIAHYDEDGFLILDGRKKDIIVTKGGEKFHPEAIEEKLNEISDVDVGVVLGDEDSVNITAVISTTQNTVTSNNSIKTQIKRINQSLPGYQKITSVIIAPEALSLENGFRTANLKLNRKAISMHFLTYKQGKAAQ